MDQKINNRVAVITGASGGIGKHIARNLAQKGYSLALVYYKHPIESLVAELSALTHVSAFQVDVSSEEEVRAFSEALKTEFGRADVLINNAGLSINAMSWKLSAEAWNNVMNVNLSGSFFMAKYLIPFMRHDSFGRIINISSVVAFTGVAGTAAYAASKAGLEGLTKTLAKEVAGMGITVNQLALGYFNEGLLFTIAEEQREQIRKTIPQERFGDPEDIAECISFLIGPYASYISGQTIHLNGGLY